RAAADRPRPGGGHHRPLRQAQTLRRPREAVLIPGGADYLRDRAGHELSHARPFRIKVAGVREKTMAKLRIAVFYDVWYEDDKETEEAKPARKGRKPDKEDHQQVHEALREAGHSPFYVTVDGTRESLAEMAKT